MIEPKLPSVVATTMLLRGFDLARRRHESAAQRRMPIDAYLPLFEALNWCMALDDRLQVWWKTNATNADKRWCDGFRFGDTVLGTRYARNRVHHQWADALWLCESAPMRPGGPSRHPGFEWRWLPLTQLPVADKGRGWFKAEYDARLAGNPARDTLAHVTECFHEALSQGVGD